MPLPLSLSDASVTVSSVSGWFAGGWGALVASVVLCVVLAGLLLAPRRQTSAPGRWIFRCAFEWPPTS